MPPTLSSSLAAETHPPDAERFWDAPMLRFAAGWLSGSASPAPSETESRSVHPLVAILAGPAGEEPQPQA